MIDTYSSMVHFICCPPVTLATFMFVINAFYQLFDHLIIINKANQDCNTNKTLTGKTNVNMRFE